ncbi:hypothetical protein FJN14_08250 [Alteromonas mediterranea]|uniref:hypothetical protein n=1 Tax=Alteromonas mediterranea TaxID=314275 RepID=UPI00113105B5|nr:hypothetical protein [Alteromonas mediterranea]QDG38437.1 hypothetical protein FJN14_08250 [Alteromonas mediterranea]
MNKLLPLISFMFLLALPSTAYAKDELIVIQKESGDGKQTTKKDRHVCVYCKRVFALNFKVSH